jgi:hypothetical protein
MRCGLAALAFGSIERWRDLTKVRACTAGKVRTETCPLFLKRITVETLWALLLLAFVH